MVNEDSRLHITVVGAAKLPAADVGGTSDPYVVIRDVTGMHMHGKQVKTSHKKKTLSPTWNETFEFTCNYKLRHLVFQVWDHDTFSKDDMLGKGKVSIDFLMDGQEHQITLPLMGKDKHKHAGELYLKLKMAFAYPVVLPGAFLVIQERNLHLGLGWDTKKKHPMDLDASVIALDGAKQLVDQVSFSHHTAFGGALHHQGDNRTGEGKGDDEVIYLDLAKLNATDPKVEYLIFTINVFSGGSTLLSVKSAYIRLMGKDTHRTMAFARLSKLDNKPGLLFGLLRKDPHTGWWTFYAIEKGVDGRKWDQSLPEIQKLI
eukprot:Phypoly_transcript_13374.p1 GENE.Phypoly_transcript_13374~~Phypoly_transcript_13374.p1  ORF type:complete len:316 (+),score=68.34 Phypoly_transcript_13374:98-1045(+)